MNDRLRFGEGASCEVVRAAARPRPVADIFAPAGLFHVEHWRRGLLIGAYDLPNTITTEGKTKLLNVMFDAVPTPRIDPWYIGLIDGVTGWSAVAAGDTFAEINGTNGWDEFEGYSASPELRPEWPVDFATAGEVAITNDAAVTYNIIGGVGSVQGLFIVGGGTHPEYRADHASWPPALDSTLWAATEFTGTPPVAVDTGDQLKVTYTVTIGA